MAGLEKGMACVKRAGKDAGKTVTIIELKGNYAVVEGKNSKKRKCNILHLLPAGKKDEKK